MNVYSFHVSGEYPGHPNHPDEDFAGFEDNRFAVFDGVTLMHQNPYPMPSPAAKAARLATEAVLQADYDSSRPEESLKKAAHSANQAIHRLNESLGVNKNTVDYLEKQYAAVVGAFGFIEDGILHGAQITDSEIVVLEPSGNILFRLETHPGPQDAYYDSLRQSGQHKINSPEEHQFVRKNVINNPNLEFRGQPIRVGVLTGEEIAETFINIGNLKLSPAHTVLFYSDGMIPYIENPSFRKYLATSKSFSDFDEKQKAAQLGTSERTIIIVKDPA